MNQSLILSISVEIMNKCEYKCTRTDSTEQDPHGKEEERVLFGKRQRDPTRLSHIWVVSKWLIGTNTFPNSCHFLDIDSFLDNNGCKAVTVC